MNINIIKPIITIIMLTTVIIIFFKKYYKKCENRTEKILYVYASAVLVFIIILYYSDKLNISGYLGIGDNTKPQNWLSILASLGTSIAAEILAGLILIYVTMLQIQENRKDMIRKEQEDRRINNMPLLVYDFLDNNNDAVKINNIYKLETKKLAQHTEITLSVKNIGMNAVRKSYVEIKGNSLIRTSICELDQQSSLDKNETKVIDFVLELENGKYNYEITIYYEDLLHNWYSQKIDLEFKLSGERNTVDYNEEKVFKVYDECIIDRPKLKTNIRKY